MGKRKMTYEEAMEALEKLAEKLKREEIPIEELPAEIKKAKALLEYCSSILRTLEQELHMSATTGEDE